MTTGWDSGVGLARNVALSSTFAIALHLFPTRKLAVAAVALPIIGIMGAERGRLAFRADPKEAVTFEKVRMESLFYAINDMAFHGLDMVAFLAIRKLVMVIPRAHLVGKIAAGLGAMPALAYLGVRVWGSYEKEDLADMAWLKWGSAIADKCLKQ